MIIYRNHYTASTTFEQDDELQYLPDSGSGGFSWHGTASEARAAAEAHLRMLQAAFPRLSAEDLVHATGERFLIPNTKPDLLHFLNTYCSHPANG